MTPLIATNPLLAAGFLNPLLAGGFGLVALPILIHLLSRRRFRRLDWAATRFLLEAERENRRRVRFEQWLLLALRCLAMALLAAVVARPFVRPGLVASLLGSHGQAARIIVIDDSASLGVRVGGGDEYESAKAAAARLVQWLAQEAPGDPVTVWITSNPAEPLVPETRLDKGRARDVVAQIERSVVSNLRAKPAGLIASIAQRLDASKDLSTADIYVISDFQKSDWIGSGESGRSTFEPLTRIGAESRQVTSKTVASVRVVLVSVTDAEMANNALLSVEIERPQIIAGLPTALNATVADFTGGSSAGGARRELVVQVEVDGAAQPPVTVDDLGVAGQKTVSMELAIADPGFCEISVRLSPGDAFAADDVRRLALRVRDSVSVLIVNGQPAIEAYADEVHFLRNALAPPGTFSSGLRVEVVDASELDGTSLTNFDCVLLCNIARPSDSAIAALTRFVRDGGGLGVFLGSELNDLPDFNRVMFGDGAGLLPVAVRDPATAPDRGVGMVRIGEHPVTAAFSPSAESISEYVRFRSYFRLGEVASADSASSSSQPASRVLARFTDAEQSPALVEHTLERGRVLLFASSVDLEWNDWARAPDGSYVVSMLEMASYLARRDEHPRQFNAGEPLVVTFAPDTFQPTAVLKSPAYPEDVAEELQQSAAGDLAELHSKPATRLGTYKLEMQPRNGLLETWPLAVNLDRSESDLRRASDEELDVALNGIPHSIFSANEGFLNGDAETRRELWPSALILLAVALVSEQLLAWWFGKVEHSGAGLRRAAIGSGETPV
ncbi:MAG: BatA domain-containing protein [Phycisphaerales bacterium]|nr:BatA domain-containing protein [Phycisphaerales bacterium]